MRTKQVQKAHNPDRGVNIIASPRLRQNDCDLPRECPASVTRRSHTALIRSHQSVGVPARGIFLEMRHEFSFFALSDGSYRDGVRRSRDGRNRF
jgi:hypothetical protein